jgi:tetratricopeptide (TPR) repeat protein
VATASITAAVIGVGGTLVVAFINGWFGLRVARKKVDPPQPIPPSSTTNTQTGQSGGQGVQANEIHGGIHQHVTAAPEILEQYGAARESIGALTKENALLNNQNAELSGLFNSVLSAAKAALAEGAQTQPDSLGFEYALDELKKGRPQAAEAVFRKIFENKKTGGPAASKEAANAAKYIGSLAYQYDRPKALAALSEAAELDPDDAIVWYLLGKLKIEAADFPGAEQALIKCRTISERNGDSLRLAESYGGLGYLYQTWQKFGEALNAHSEAYQQMQSIQAVSKNGMASALWGLGIIFDTNKDFDNAKKNFLKAMSLFKETGWDYGFTGILNSLGYLAFRRYIHLNENTLGEAKDYYMKSMPIAEKINDLNTLSVIYGNIADVLRREKKYNEAHNYWCKSPFENAW